MLRADVVEACWDKVFSIYAVSTIDEGVSILSGLIAGERGANGKFAADSVNARVEARSQSFATIRRQFGVKSSGRASAH